MKQTPRFAVVSPNTLLCLGMKSLLESIIPEVEVVISNSVEQIAHQEFIFHYFITADAAAQGGDFLTGIRRRTIILVDAAHPSPVEGFRTINIDQPEQAIRCQIMLMQSQGHSHLQPADQPLKTPLTPREREVLVLLVKGLINKEIAHRLNVSLTTVISHRRNIVEKLGMRSLSSLTVYAISKGLISPLDILT